ncbi:maltose ABC transporter permease MalF, partial [Klebsiella pneumoniae]|nr:maltose ABC transporter permease MalF [Klebsiella pneumoniae]
RGPPTPAGDPALLVSYTYRIAREGGGGQDCGLAAAIATRLVLLFGEFAFVYIIVGVLIFDVWC